MSLSIIFLSWKIPGQSLAGFVEGVSLDDTNEHFVLQKIGTNLGGASHMYLAVYRSKRELSFKECKITCLIDPGCLFKTDTRDRFQIIKKSPYLTILYMASVRTPIFL